MSVYKRENTWWYSFRFAGRRIQESAKTHSKTLAKDAERKRRRELELGYNNITQEHKHQRIQTIREAAATYEQGYQGRHTEKSCQYLKYCVRHLVEHLGSETLIEIAAQTVISYQSTRLNEKASGKTINDEVGELFRILGETGAAVRMKMKREKTLKLPQNENVGRPLSEKEENTLIEAARKSPSPNLYPALMLALNTGMRDAEIRHTKWKQIDFLDQILRVGRAKTAAGTHRRIQLNSSVLAALADHMKWYEQVVGSPEPERYVFPSAASQYRGRCCQYNPERPVTSFKTAWTTLRRNTGVWVRWHDTRHTLVRKLAESGAGDETIRSIAGHVSQRMLEHYSHIRTAAKRKALENMRNFANDAPYNGEPVHSRRD